MAHLAFSTVERSSRRMPTVRTLYHGALFGVSHQVSKRLILRQSWVRIWRIRVGFSCDVSHGALSCLNGVQHPGVTGASMADVVVEQGRRFGHDGPVRGEYHVRFERRQPLKLLKVDVHVSLTGWNQDGANPSHHVACDQSGFAQQAKMAGVVAGRVKDVPAVVTQLDDVTVLEGPIDAHAAMFMPPNGHIKGLAQEVLISNVVAILS